MSVGDTIAASPNTRNSGPLTFVLFVSAVPVVAPLSFCSHRYVTVSPSASVALPVSANGVRTGMVTVSGTVTTGAWLVVSSTSQPPLSMAPPLAVSPTKPEVPEAFVSSSDATLVVASVPPNVTWKPLSLSVPLPPNAATVTVAPAGQPAMPSMAALMPAVV